MITYGFNPTFAEIAVADDVAVAIGTEVTSTGTIAGEGDTVYGVVVGYNGEYVAGRYAKKMVVMTGAAPAFSAADKGKVLAVNSEGDGLEWITLS